MVIIFVVFSTLLGRFEILQNSMEPNFHPGQRVMVSRLASLWSTASTWVQQQSGTPAIADLGLKHGQIAVFYELPNNQGDPLIKRVIGVPGDSISVREGHIFVNDIEQEEPYIGNLFTTCQSYCDNVQLGPGQYFMMGDNRGISRDSRIFGPIPSDQIVGRVIARYWPLSDLSLFP